MRCDEITHHTGAGITMFQSLSGFLMRCDTDCPICDATCTAGFQSLSGFLMRCDHAGRHAAERVGPVSIPIGFSDAL